MLSRVVLSSKCCQGVFFLDKSLKVSLEKKCDIVHFVSLRAEIGPITGSVSIKS